MNPHSSDTSFETKSETSKTARAKKKRDGDVRYNGEIAARICEQIASRPVSLCEICRDPDLPGIATVFRWLRDHPDFREMYVIAKQEQVEFLLEQCLDLVRDDSRDYLERDGRTILNPVAVQRAKLQVDFYKWIASKLLPRKYGNNAQLAAAAAPPPPPPPPPPDGGEILTVEKLLYLQKARREYVDRMLPIWRAESAAAESPSAPPRD